MAVWEPRIYQVAPFRKVRLERAQAILRLIQEAVPSVVELTASDADRVTAADVSKRVRLYLLDRTPQVSIPHMTIFEGEVLWAFSQFGQCGVVLEDGVAGFLGMKMRVSPPLGEDAAREA